MVFEHKSVMLSECIAGLLVSPDGVYVDGTLGGGGHAREICEKLNAGLLVGIDRDIQAIEAAGQALSRFSDKTLLVRGSFFNMPSILQALDIKAVDGVLLDLGVSSHQLDEPSRGFSYMHDAPLDMRMDSSQKLSAYDVVNGYDEAALSGIIADFGEERWARRIAKFIVAERSKKPIRTTFELVSVIKAAMPKGAREAGPHPAKRTFQAIRIEVNNELAGLTDTLPDIIALLSPGGRVCVVTFHSLEDRIVKNVFRSLENPCVCPPGLPVCVCGKTPVIKTVTKKPVTPDPEELERNPRARSAKLRIAEKL